MMKTKLFVYVLLFIVPIRFSIAYGELEGEWICDIKVNDSVSLIMPSTSDIPFNISISVNGDPHFIGAIVIIMGKIIGKEIFFTIF